MKTGTETGGLMLSQAARREAVEPNVIAGAVDKRCIAAYARAATRELTQLEVRARAARPRAPENFDSYIALA